MKPADDHRFNTGDVVYAMDAPGKALTVRRYVDRIYYCTVRDDASHKELVYFDRELLESKPVAK